MNETAVDTLLWHGVLYLVGGALLFKACWYAGEVGLWHLFQHIIGTPEVDEDEDYKAGYDDGYQDRDGEVSAAESASAEREPEFPDWDEDQRPADPSGRHAPGEGRVSVDEATGYVRLDGGALPVADLPLLSGQDGGR